MNGMVEEIRKLAAEKEATEKGSPNKVIREVVQHDILKGIAISPASSRVALRGGAALRRAYQNPRYSIDLDLVRGKSGSISEEMDVIGDGIRTQLKNRFGEDASVAGPKSPKKGDKAHFVQIHRLEAKLRLGKRDVPLLRIPIEVADVPAYDYHPEMLPRPLEMVGRDFMINVCSREEILADKVIAFAGRKVIRNRDLWDIRWLVRHNILLDLDLLLKKAADYGLEGSSSEGLAQLLELRLAEMATIFQRAELEEELREFLDPVQAEVWIDQGRADDLLTAVRRWLEGVVRQLRQQAGG